MRKVIIVLFLGFSLINKANSNECGQYFDNLTSPFCTQAKYIFWTGTALTLAAKLNYNNVAKDIEKRSVDKNHLRGFGEIGNEKVLLKKKGRDTLIYTIRFLQAIVRFLLLLPR